MGEGQHLFEADKVRIQNEAKVRTALEQPDFAQREFDRWREAKEREMRHEQSYDSRRYFVSAWARVAWLAEGRMHTMGRELAKAQARIGRQRKANRELVQQLRAAREGEQEIPDSLEKLGEGK